MEHLHQQKELDEKERKILGERIYDTVKKKKKKKVFISQAYHPVYCTVHDFIIFFNHLINSNTLNF